MSMIWAAQSGLLQVRVFCLLNSYSFFRFSIHSSYIDSKNILMQGLLATYLICESIGKKEASYMQISTDSTAPTGNFSMEVHISGVEKHIGSWRVPSNSM